MRFRKREDSDKLADSASESDAPQIELTAPPRTIVVPDVADTESASVTPATVRPDPTLGLATKKLREGGGRNRAPSSAEVYPSEGLSPVGSNQSL